MRHKATEVLSIIAGTVSAKEFNMYVYSWKYLRELRFTMIWDILEHCIVVSQVENLVKIFHDHERSWMILSRSLSWKDLAKILASSYQDPVTISNKLMFARS